MKYLIYHTVSEDAEVEPRTLATLDWQSDAHTARLDQRKHIRVINPRH
jgi:hypothetical protein